MISGALDNVFINGDFLLWTRLSDPSAAVESPVWRQTFAADRWKLRYANPDGAPVTQASSKQIPDALHSGRSLEIRATSGVTQNVFLGQRVESAEAPRYRRRLLFSAWVFATHGAPVNLVFTSASRPDAFDEMRTRVEHIEQLGALVPNQWAYIECEIDARGFSPDGLSVEIEFSAASLSEPDAVIRVATARLADISCAGRELERPAAIESLLAKRFYQRHDSSTVNSLGRALVINAHELHFQFTFPEMRGFPACTLPQDNAAFRVFDLEGFSQEGFFYDATHRSRGSVIVRATKENHCVRDGYLSFVGGAGAILLDAEL